MSASVECGEQVFGISAHPSRPLLSAALIDGRLQIFSSSAALEGDTALLATLRTHTAACRSCAFSVQGDLLYSAGADKQLVVLDAAGVEMRRFMAAHGDPLNRVIALESASVLATGDDAGCVRVWDARDSSTRPALSWSQHEDYVSSLLWSEEGAALYSTAGDATLCVYDLRRPDTAVRSDDQEDELLCVQVLKNNRKVVVGAQDGALLLFSQGRFGDCSDRFPGHPSAVNCLHKVDESTLLTGAEDGLIRVVSLLPNRVLGVVGDHDAFPVEGMALCCDGRVLASYAHDELVRFWDVSMFRDDAEENGDDEEGLEEYAQDVEEDEDEVDDDEEEDMELVEESSEMNGGSGEDSYDDSEDDDAPANSTARRELPSSNQKFYADM